MFHIHTVDCNQNTAVLQASPLRLTITKLVQIPISTPTLSLEAHSPIIECTVTGVLVLKAVGGANGDWYAGG
jgi:hypothetical protein